MALLPMGAGLPIPGINLGGGAPSVPMRINYDYFFDRQLIKNTLDDATRKALYKSGSIVMQIARRSIKRKGIAAAVKTRILKDNPDDSIRQLIERTSASGDRKNNRMLIKRLAEIRSKDPSPAGSPPFTHRGNLRDQPGIVFAYDPTTESVVVGQSAVGIAWMAALHEFGGEERQQAWAFVPRYRRSYRTGILGWWRIGTGPQKTDRWVQTQFRRAAPYPARPYMRPAIAKAIATRDIVKQFQDRFRVGGT